MSGASIVELRITPTEKWNRSNKRFTPEPAPAQAFYTASFYTIDFNAAAASGLLFTD